MYCRNYSSMEGGRAIPFPSCKRKGKITSPRYPLIILRAVFLSFLAISAFLTAFHLFSSSPSPSSPPPLLRDTPWRRRDPLGVLHSTCKPPRPDSNINNTEPYFLAAVIFSRVFQGDQLGITAFECKQWIEYMLYAGVQHVFWYDTGHSDEESIEAELRTYVEGGILTYYRFHTTLFPGHLHEDFHFEQDNSYTHFLRNHGRETTWVVEMDVDEYPFSPNDTDSCFLTRLLLTKVDTTQVSQLALQCFLYGGEEEPPPSPSSSSSSWLIERYTKRKTESEGEFFGFPGRTKPIFRPALSYDIASPADPHVFAMKKGETELARPELIRMNHYWGLRLSIPSSKLQSDPTIQLISSRIKGAIGFL